jgi:hypothetical protein
VLDEIARRESLTGAPEDVDKEVERFAERSVPPQPCAQLEKDGASRGSRQDCGGEGG